MNFLSGVNMKWIALIEKVRATKIRPINIGVGMRILLCMNSKIPAGNNPKSSMKSAGCG